MDMSASYGDVILLTSVEEEVDEVEAGTGAGCELVGDWRGVDVLFGGCDDVGLSNVDFQLLLSLVSAPSSDTIEISAIIPLSVNNYI